MKNVLNVCVGKVYKNEKGARVTIVSVSKNGKYPFIGDNLGSYTESGIESGDADNGYCDLVEEVKFCSTCGKEIHLCEGVWMSEDDSDGPQCDLEKGFFQHSPK